TASADASINNQLVDASAVIDVGVGPVLGTASVVVDNSGSIGLALVAAANATGATTAQDADATASMNDGFILEAFNNNNGDAIVSFTNSGSIDLSADADAVAAGGSATAHAFLRDAFVLRAD